MKLGIIVVLTLVVSALVATFVMGDTGQVLINYRGYMIEMSVPVLVGLFIVLVTVIWLLRKIWQAPLYAWLVAIFPILSIAAQNPGQIRTLWVAAALAGMLAAVSVLILGYRLLLRSWSKAGLALLATTMAFYVYGPVSAALDGLWMQRSDQGDMTAAPALGYSMTWLLSGGRSSRATAT